MGTKTGIEWTDATWNPVRGCSRVSRGCENCYAEKVAYRFSQPGQPYAGLAVLKNGHASWTGKVEFVEKHLLDPLKWRTPRRIFVNSMSDLFHENVTDEMRDKIFAVMALCPQHTFQVLTKRPERMFAYMTQLDEEHRGGFWRDAMVEGATQKLYSELHPDEDHDSISMSLAVHLPLPNVWLGVSVENQAAADERIPLLLETPAAVRFISAEPLLGLVDLEDGRGFLGGHTSPECDGSEDYCSCECVAGLDWVICGGESGAGARPMHPDWARSLRDQCAAAGVPFFFKQWGEWTPGENVERTDGVVRGAHWFDGEWSYGPEDLAYNEGHRDDEPDVYLVGKHAAGALLDGVEHKAFPEAQR